MLHYFCKQYQYPMHLFTTVTGVNPQTRPALLAQTHKLSSNLPWVYYLHIWWPCGCHNSCFWTVLHNQLSVCACHQCHGHNAVNHYWSSLTRTGVGAEKKDEHEMANNKTRPNDKNQKSKKMLDNHKKRTWAWLRLLHHRKKGSQTLLKVKKRKRQRREKLCHGSEWTLKSIHMMQVPSFKKPFRFKNKPKKNTIYHLFFKQKKIKNKKIKTTYHFLKMHLTGQVPSFKKPFR